MFSPKSLRTLAVASVVAFAGACETGTGPEVEATFDADAALDDYQALDLLFQSDAMAGFRALGAGLTFQGVSPEVEFALRAGGEMGVPSASGGALALAGRIFSATEILASGPHANPIISNLRRGKTFVYSPDLGRYVLDQELEGAPPTGVRFILYQPGTDGKPNPANEIGYADLIDEGDNSVEEIALRLVVVEGSVTRLEYGTTLDLLDNGGKIRVAGYLQGEEDRLDFDIQVQGSNSGEQNTVDIGFEMGIASRDFLINGSVSGVENESGDGGEVNLLVRHGSDSFQVEALGSETHIDGEVHLNGGLFATVTGDPDQPEITGASGNPLSWTEMLVLRQILDSTEDVFDFWEDLLDPVDELVILAIIL